jgi:hypothetical protein
MTQLIDPSSPEYFHQSSNEPYLRHNYKLVYESGKTVVFDNYEDIQRTWFQYNGKFLSHVEVLDYKKPKSKKKNGF